MKGHIAMRVLVEHEASMAKNITPVLPKARGTLEAGVDFGESLLALAMSAVECGMDDSAKAEKDPISASRRCCALPAIFFSAFPAHFSADGLAWHRSLHYGMRWAMEVISCCSLRYFPC